MTTQERLAGWEGVVTQADREAAIPYLQDSEWHPSEIICGEADSHWLVQAFARHRLTAIEECAKEADRFYQAYPRETVADVTAWEIATAIRNLAPPPPPSVVGEGK